jgi:hypothetical protein
MLTKDLLVARRYRGKIHPRFADPNSRESQELAGRILKTFQAHVGQSRERLARALADLEGPRNFKLVRGLAQLLERRSLFEPCYTIEPPELRRWLFREGYVTSHQERRARFEEAARCFGISAEELERTFWADREENHILRGFLEGRAAPKGEPAPDLLEEPGIAPQDLLRQYNLSLAQTLLFDALELWFEVSENYQQIFRWIKCLGLMYEAVEVPDGRVKVKVDGPASLFKETTKYGTALAKLLPALVRAQEFRLEARIKEGQNRYTFELDHSKRSLFPLLDSHRDRESADASIPLERFDSAVEANFYRRIRGVMRDWEVKREPTIFKAGRHIFIPDFGFERRGVRYYLEIVGFWTPEYLKKKLAKLKATETNLLVAVDKKLNCTEEELKETGQEFFLYEKRLPLEPVIRRLLDLAERQTARERERLNKQPLPLPIDGEVIPLAELARANDVGVEALREVLAGRIADGRIQGRRLIGDRLVSQQLLERLRAELDALPADDEADDDDNGGRSLAVAAVQGVLERHGLTEAALEAVGYKVERESLLEARVVRLHRSRG